MKSVYKIILIAIYVAIDVACISLLWQTEYNNANASEVPVSPITIASHEIMPESLSATVPILGRVQRKIPFMTNLLEPIIGQYYDKRITCTRDGFSWDLIEDNPDPLTLIKVTSLEEIGSIPYMLEIELPNTMMWSVNLSSVASTGAKSTVNMSGGLGQGNEGLDPGSYTNENYLIQKQGDYTLYVVGTFGGNPWTDPSGSVYYQVDFSLGDPTPGFTPGQLYLRQGDVLSLKLTSIPDNIVPELYTGLGASSFTQGLPLTPKQDGDKDYPNYGPAEGFMDWYAVVPVSNDREPGDYPVTVRTGDETFELTVTVSEYDFPFQNMIVDSNQTTATVATSNEAIEEFRERVTSLLPLFTETRYWDGLFIMPVELGEYGFVSTEFGEVRITNGNMDTMRSHVGMDISVDTGTPVHAIGAGKVLLAEFLLNTGYTVIIDHGGGLKSLYYHMDTVETEADKIVARGDLIGKVGSTGYSTGPHLHLEVRIGDQPINPSMLFDPGAGIYSAE